MMYQAHVWIRQITPMIWRRPWVRSDSTLADLHYPIQIALGWTDIHLRRFHLRGKAYGIPRAYGPWCSTDARKVTLAELGCHPNERFVYNYDFGGFWNASHIGLVAVEHRVDTGAQAGGIGEVEQQAHRGIREAVFTSSR